MELLKDQSFEKELSNMRKYLIEDETCLFLMAKTAFHHLGDISRDEWDLALVFEEDKDNLYGQWAYGYGLIDVKFPKNSVKKLSKKEIKKYSGSYINRSDIKNRLWEKK